MDKRNLRSAGFIVLGMVAVVILFLSLSPNFVSNVFAADKIGAKNAPVTPNEHVKALNQAFIDASNAVVPTVVSISVVVENKAHQNRFRDEFREFFRFFGDPFGGDGEERSYESEASGSGVIITDNGYIVTNNHVVENAKEIKVTLNDRKEYAAELIGSDPLTDLAVLKIDASNLTPVHFANIDDVKIGEWVIAVGNPLGLNSTVTTGIVSAIGRGGLSLMRQKGPSAVENFIQTDAAINPGNSGGGLFNLEGSLVGINTAIATQTGSFIGYGFAIPVDLVKAVVMDLIEDGKVNRGQLGVMIRSVDELLAKSLGLDEVTGVLVDNVVPKSAAEKAGLEPGDVILEIDGKKLNSSNELQSAVTLRKAGDKVKLTIWRNEKKIVKEVTLQKRVDLSEVSENDEPVEVDDSSEDIGNFDKIGFTVKPLTSEDKSKFSVSAGVMITDVKRNSEAFKRGMRSGGVITKIERKQIKSVKDIKQILDSKNSGDAVMFQIKYQDTFRMIALLIP